MEREEFIREFNKVKENKKYVSKEYILNQCNKSIDSTIKEDKFRGETQLKIAIEEMAELTQQITKTMRGKQDTIHLLEEFADVCLILGYIKETIGFIDEDIKTAITVKSNRLKENLIEGKCV